MKDLKRKQQLLLFKERIYTYKWVYFPPKRIWQLFASYLIIYSYCNNCPATLDCLWTINQKEPIRREDLRQLSLWSLTTCFHVQRPDPKWTNGRAEKCRTHHPRLKRVGRICRDTAGCPLPPATFAQTSKAVSVKSNKFSLPSRPSLLSNPSC